MEIVIYMLLNASAVLTCAFMAVICWLVFALLVMVGSLGVCITEDIRLRDAMKPAIEIARLSSGNVKIALLIIAVTYIYPSQDMIRTILG